jgi:hypothetical protein
MQKTKRTFTKEFKLETVKLAHSNHKSLAQIARDLGNAENTLHRWCHQFSEHGEQNLLRFCGFRLQPNYIHAACNTHNQNRLFLYYR